jgi:hypothetical protein
MTCKFFTILHTYFRCCVTRENTDNLKKDSIDSNVNIQYNSDGEYSPTFTFDDLSRSFNSYTSTNSSSSSLNDFESQQQSVSDVSLLHTQGRFTKRAQAYKQSYFQPFIGVSPYQQ